MSNTNTMLGVGVTAVVAAGVAVFMLKPRAPGKLVTKEGSAPADKPTPAKGLAATDTTGCVSPFKFERRAVGDDDVRIDIQYAGMCHSDVHTIRSEWGPCNYPCVPGHEIGGLVSAIGSNVTKFKIGDRVGVGCFVDSCSDCPSCKSGDENYCTNTAGNDGLVMTYNTKLADGSVTQGGYSSVVVVKEYYVCSMPKNLDFAGATPLLCAGITVYSPFKYYGLKKGDNLLVVGLGGLGHMAVKFGAAFGANVTVCSRNDKKKAMAMEMGATSYLISEDPEAMTNAAGTFDFILDTVSAKHDINGLLGLLKANGKMCLVGVPPENFEVHAFSLIPKRLSLVGSLIGGIPETQEMLDFCGVHSITCDIELIKADSKEVNNAFERMVKGDVRFRFVIDIANTL